MARNVKKKPKKTLKEKRMIKAVRAEVNKAPKKRKRFA